MKGSPGFSDPEFSLESLVESVASIRAVGGAQAVRSFSGHAWMNWPRHPPRLSDGGLLGF